MSRGLSRILERLDLNSRGAETDQDIARPPMKSSKSYRNYNDDGEQEDFRIESGVTNKGLCYDSDDEINPRELKSESRKMIKWKEDQPLQTHDIDPKMSNAQALQLRKRRRSSARFLRLSGRFNEENLTDDVVDGEQEQVKFEHLGEMYREVIRMNAENKINASNSWGLKLIENIDKFLEEDLSSHAQSVQTPYDAKGRRMMGQVGNHESTDMNALAYEPEKRINFTKASCTLDASVKIYSYRVDDVYLSSYKVLANLNRTDGKSISSPESEISSDDKHSIQPISDDENSEHAPKKLKERRSIRTLEENMGTFCVYNL